MRISYVIKATLIAILLGGGCAHAALMNYTETFTDSNGLNVLHFQADDTVPTVITSLTGTVGEVAISGLMAPGAIFFNNNIFNPLKFNATAGGWDPAGIAYSVKLYGYNTMVHLFSAGGSVVDNYGGVVTGWTGTATPTATPIPAALFMFAPGVLGLFGYEKRRKNRLLAQTANPQDTNVASA